MNIVEFIGFIITMLALFFIFMRQMKEESRRREMTEEEFEEIEGDPSLKELLETMNIEIKEKPKPPTPPKPVAQIKEPTLVKRSEEWTKKESTYVTKTTNLDSSAWTVLEKAQSLKDAVILREILGPPKALHDPNDYH